MAKVEHVADRPGRRQYSLGLPGQYRPGSEAGGRVEVSLQGLPWADPDAGQVEWDPPVDTDHVGAGVGEAGQQFARSHAEHDAGHLVGRQAVKDAAKGRQHIAAVVGRRQGAPPALEDLHRRRPRADLRVQAGQGYHSQAVHQRGP